MGVMNEPLARDVRSVEASNRPVTAEEIEVVAKSSHGAHTEIELDTELSFIKLHAAIYEDGKPTNRLINVNKPWEVRVYFGITGPLQEMICGKWCVSANFESIGPGEEFRLKHPDFYFDCHQQYWCLRIPGKVDPTACGDPYRVTVTVRAISKCDTPLGIIGFATLPEVLFFEKK